MCFYGYFLINCFIPVRWAKAITWENFALSKQQYTRGNPISTKEGSRLCRDETSCMLSQNVIYEEFITLARSRLSRTEFHPGQPGSCNHHLRQLFEHS